MSEILITTSSFAIADNSALSKLQQKGFKLKLNPYRRKLSENELLSLVGKQTIAVIAGVEPWTAKVMDAAPNLKIISRCGVGMDSVDLEAAAKRNITVSNTPDGPSIAVAELTVALMLNALRHICASDRAMRQGEFKRAMGSLLAGKTVGIVGFGRIGKKVGQLVEAFGAKTLKYDPALSADTPGYVDFSTLITSSDIVSLHVPYSPQTHHLINQQVLSDMPNHALLINASRGGLVDEEALAKALRENVIADAAIDCFEQEPYNGPLVELDNAVLTAHIGGYAAEARKQMEQEAVSNVLNALL